MNASSVLSGPPPPLDDFLEARRRKDPCYFARTTLGLIPHETQALFLRNRHQVKVAACGRRWGKSLAAAIDVLHLALYPPPSATPSQQMVVAPTGDQTGIICSQVERFLLDTPALAGKVERLTHSPFWEVHLQGGATIRARSAGETGRNMRGWGAHRVVVDEAAFVPERVIQEAIIPMLADSDGQMVLISTPFGHNTFWDYFVRGMEGTDPTTKAFQFPSHLNPHISAAYIEKQRGTMTDLQFRTEWLAEFCDDQSTVFKWALIERATTGSLADPLEGHRYAIGWDPSKYHDKSAIVILDRTTSPLHVVACETIEGRDYTLQVLRVAELARRYNKAAVQMDCTGNDALLEALQATSTHCAGVKFTNAAKQELIDGVVIALEKERLTFPVIPPLLTEMRFYEYSVTAAGNVRLGAPDRAGAYDDLVTALALAVQGATALTDGTMEYMRRQLAVRQKAAV